MSIPGMMLDPKIVGLNIFALCVYVNYMVLTQK